MPFNLIAIEREYASGGREIGEKLAERLSIPCYGDEIVRRAAAELNLPVDQIRSNGLKRYSPNSSSWDDFINPLMVTSADRNALPLELSLLKEHHNTMVSREQSYG